jgi:hypothetical protein
MTATRLAVTHEDRTEALTASRAVCWPIFWLSSRSSCTAERALRKVAPAWSEASASKASLVLPAASIFTPLSLRSL